MTLRSVLRNRQIIMYIVSTPMLPPRYPHAHLVYPENVCLVGYVRPDQFLDHLTVITTPYCLVEAGKEERESL